jgi:hypothetical protein
MRHGLDVPAVAAVSDHRYSEQGFWSFVGPPFESENQKLERLPEMISGFLAEE